MNNELDYSLADTITDRNIGRELMAAEQRRQAAAEKARAARRKKEFLQALAGLGLFLLMLALVGWAEAL